MRALVTVLFLLCAVLSLTAPVSAGYIWYENVDVDEFTTALLDYCNENTVHNMPKHEFELSNHDFKVWGVTRTNESLDFRFRCCGRFWLFVPIPFPFDYEFEGTMHVDNPQDSLKKPYTLTITEDETKFTATGENWRLEVENNAGTRFEQPDNYFEKDVNATELTDALMKYVNTNSSIDNWGRELSNHAVEVWEWTRTEHALELNFTCKDRFWVFAPAPAPVKYYFTGVLHVDNPQDGLKKPYTLAITDGRRAFKATGENWWLEVWDISETRFKV